MSQPSLPSRKSATFVQAAELVKRGWRWLNAGDRRLAWAMALLVVYYVTTRGVFEGKASGDGLFGLRYLRAIFYHHTLDMKQVLPHYLPYFGVIPATGRMPNRCPFGPVLVWLPLYLVACALYGLGRLAHLAPPSMGDTPFHAWFTGLGTLLFVLIGWRSLYRLLERHLGRDAALLGSVAAVWATPIAWYAVTQPHYQHGLAFGLATLLVDRWDLELGQTRLRRFAVLGLIGGAAMSMRAQEMLYLLLPAGEIAWHLAAGPDRRRWLAGGAVLVLVALAAFLPQLAVWYYYTHTLLPPQVEQIRWGTPFLVATLFSTRAGIFPWSPVAYAAVVGLVLAFGRGIEPSTRRLTLALTVVFALDLYVVAAAWVVGGGYSYGARRLSDTVVLLGLGIALLFTRIGARGRQLLIGFVALCVALNLVGMEMLRHGRTASSGGYARTAGRWLEEARAPAWLSRLLERTGYPFVQPAGWLFAWRHHVSASAFEGVVGNFFLDRDSQWRSVTTPDLILNWRAQPYVAEGLALAEREPAQVTGRVRLLLPMFAAERVGVRVSGFFPAGEASAAWNGVPLAVRRSPAATLDFDAPVELVAAGVNELTLDLPPASRLTKLTFVSSTRWWK